MECSILKPVNGRLEQVGILPHKSIVWEECWQKAGSFQAVFAVTPQILNAVKVGNFVAISIRNTAMYIHSVQIKGNEIWAYGYEAKQLLDKVALLPMTYGHSVALAETIESVIEDNVPYSWFDAFASSTESIGTADIDGMEYLSVLGFIQECAVLKSAGFKLVLNSAFTKLSFVLKRGVDRSETAIFSKLFGNIGDAYWTQSDKSYITKVIALGSNGITETAEEQIDQDAEEYSAVLDLRESFPWDEEELTEQEYRNAIAVRANMSLIARHATESVEVNSIDTADFEVKYEIGDIVSVSLPQIGKVSSQRIIAAKWTIEGNKTTLALSFKEV